MFTETLFSAVFRQVIICNFSFSNTIEAKSKFWCLKILIYQRYCESIMGNIDKVLQPECHDIFFKYWLFEKYLADLQNLTS